MTDDQSGTLGETSRRTLLKNTLLVGAGLATIGVTSTSLVGSAQAATPEPQWKWAWCSKCQGLYYAPGGHEGVCPAGGSHGAAVSFNYGLYNYENATDWQDHWAYCANCWGLFYGAAPTGGACPFYHGASPHYVLNSFDYNVYYGPIAYSNMQTGWRWCGQCQGMFFSGGNLRGGICPYGNGAFSHNSAGSYAYRMLDSPA